MVSAKHKKTHKKENEAKAPEKKRKTPVAYWAVLIVALLLVAAGLWWVKGMGVQESSPTLTIKEDSGTMTMSAKAYLDALEKLTAFPQDYMLVFNEDRFGLDTQVSLVSKGDERLGVLKTKYDKKKFVWLKNSTIVCEQIENEDEVCAQMKDGTGVENLAKQVESLFINREMVQQNFRSDKLLIEWGALKFNGKPKTEKVAGRECEVLDYTIDYSTLTVKQMRQVGMSPTVIDRISDIKAKQCADTKYGLGLKVELQYNEMVAPGKVAERKFVREYKSIETKDVPKIEIPQNLAEFETYKAKFDEAERLLKVFGQCESEDNSSKCIRNAAISTGDVGLCSRIQDEETANQCFLMLAQMTLKTELCQKSGNYSDECYGSIAIGTRNASLCEQVGNQTMKEECVSRATAEPTVANETVKEEAVVNETTQE